ncbi:YeeE/YedE family protein [Rubellimicrobium sp. CFH 75288]|uniref:YeeE/YedE family protein n=1 Tax=Rubellimicrobium sp. CFH 75288 TaxID=2697034 RepID=UPI001FB73393|nr:YeeE/YedE family protein [Rubellimicrobium sp. CFH 75288]
MIPTEFTPLNALIGGAMIGLASVLLMALFGRIAGISGIAVRMFPPYLDDESLGRVAFVLGLIVSPALVLATTGSWPPVRVEAAPLTVVIGGLLVGFGSVWGAGCTSGHGVCGLSRLSVRSFVAVGTFMAVAVLTVFVSRHLI